MKPKLRNLEFIPIEHKGDAYFLARDRQGFAADTIVPRAWGGLLALLNGKRDVPEIILAYSLKHDEVLPRDIIDRIIAQLDEALLLESPRFRTQRDEDVRAFEQANTRPALMVDSDADRLKSQIAGFFAKAAQVKVLSPRPSNGQLRGIIVPHIDFQRGGVTEALAYQQLLNEQFDTFVVLGIAHAGVHYPFCGAAKDFETPLGIARCNRELLCELSARVGDEMLREQYAHKNEHSIEFVAVFLQYLAQFKNTTIVPIICGGFFDELRTGASPMDNPEVAQFVKALRDVVQENEARGGRIGLIASVDLSHVGSRFGDDEVLTPGRLKDIEAQDLQFLKTIEAGNKEAMHAALAKDNNTLNVDAHPAVYILMAAFPELRAQLLGYQQAFDKEANSVVSFAAMTLLTEDPRG